MEGATRRLSVPGPRSVAALALVAAGACSPIDIDPAGPAPAAGPAACALEAPVWGLGGARMLPGTDCLSCHVDGGPAAPLSVGGTVFRTNLCPEPVEGAVVRVADRLGVTLELVSNEVGNFHATEPLALPLSVSVEADGVLRVMSSPAAGSCGACHDGGVEGAVWVWSGTGANAE